MKIVCILGLVACLNYADKKIPWEDAWDIVDICAQGLKLQSSQYIGATSIGLVYMEMAEDRGLEFKWGTNPAARKSIFISACIGFLGDYEDHTKWDNYHKVP